MTAIAKHIGRIGALAVALGVGVATGAPASATDVPPPRTALIMCGTTCPTPNQFWIDNITNQFVVPTHSGEAITPVKVTAPMEFWPITGLFRVIGLALGPPSIWGPGGPGWPNEPLWKLSGLFDLTADKSLQGGVAGLEDAMADNLGDPLVIYGNSQGAGIANVEKRKLAEQYPEGTNAPDIDFVLGGDPNLPNGGLMSRFSGLYIPIVNLTFNGPALTDTQFDTVEINEQYDGFADFPLYPLNFVADLNALLGIVYVHMYGLDLSLPAEHPTESPAYQYHHGDTDYYFFENSDLPLFGPLRTLGVPEPVIDVFEPFFRVIVEQGYDRSIPAWQPTPARLIPKFEPAKLATDLVDAIGEGIDNAGALVKPAPSLKLTAASTNTGVDEDVQSVELQTNESVGAVQSVVDGGNTVKSSDRSNNSTPFKAGHARPTPLRDAVKTLSSDVKKVVDKVSDNIKKAMTAGSKPQSATDG
jgi:hypothetical protein